MKNTLVHFLNRYQLEAYIEFIDLIFIVLDVTIILTVAWFISRIAKKIIHGIEARITTNSSLEDKKRIQTLSRVMRYITSVVIFVLTITTILSTLGIPVAPLLATAGVAGVAIGFGAQSLVKDYFTGFVMLVENQIRQGDLVEIAGKIGSVEEVTLRYIRLRDYEGVVHYVPNSVITVVTNRSRNFIYAVLDVGVAYKTDIAQLNNVLKRVAMEMREDPQFKDNILGDLEIAGLDSFGDSAITVRCRMMVDTTSQMPIKREFQGRLKIAFENEGIEIPYRHIVIQNQALIGNEKP